jgi:hypothetical protein
MPNIISHEDWDRILNHRNSQNSEDFNEYIKCLNKPYVDANQTAPTLRQHAETLLPQQRKDHAYQQTIGTSPLHRESRIEQYLIHELKDHIAQIIFQEYLLRNPINYSRARRNNG